MAQQANRAQKVPEPKIRRKENVLFGRQLRSICSSGEAGGRRQKSAYIIGTGLAGLSAAFYLVRDGQMKGEHIHLLEKLELAGGSCDGRKDVTKGFYMRGGREMDNHFECMWDMYRDVPSIETPGVSVLDEYYWLNKKDPNYSLCRATENRGQNAHTDGLFKLDKNPLSNSANCSSHPKKTLKTRK